MNQIENSLENQIENSLDTTKALSALAREISSTEAVFDGLDAIAGAVEGLATLSALKAIAQQFRNDKHPSDIQKTAEAIVKTAEQIEQVEQLAQPASAEELNLQANLRVENFNLFASQAVMLLDRKTSLLEGNTSDEEEPTVSSSRTKLKAKNINLENIDDQLNQIQARLNLVQNNLDQRNLDRDRSLSPQEIYEKWKTYLVAIESLQPKSESSSFQFSISTKRLGEIELNSAPQQQQISIKKEGQVLYQAQERDGQWQVTEDRLTPEQKQLSLALPQTKKEVIAEYTGRYLAKFLHQTAQAEVKSHPLVQWEHQLPNNELAVYQFSIDKSNPSKTVIKGSNDRQQRIFAAEVSRNGLIEVQQNEIPLAYLQELIEENPLSSIKQKRQKRQESQPKSPRKSLQL